MLRKRIGIIFAIFLMLSINNAAYASTVDAITENSMNQDATPRVVHIEESVLHLGKSDIQKTEKFNQGLVATLKKFDYSPALDTDGTWKSNEGISNAIENYCKNHYDVLSGAIFDRAMEKSKNHNIQIDLDENSEAYRKNTETYAVNSNVSITITPDEIYLDETVEELPRGKLLASKTSWKYKTVATRRTLFKKASLEGETYTFKIYSVHTGGEVKYNGTTAKHSAGYYAYSLQETYGSPFVFKKIAKQSEQISGTSWHYKYLGKVTGSVSITSPIKMTYKEKVLGCQVIVSKTGKVTKKYWPTL